MDPVTQGILGSSLSQAFASKKNIKIATFCGIFGGIAADLDILIKSTSDQLLFLQYHRHFTHSLFFIPFGSLFTSLILLTIFKILNKQIPFKVIYIFTFLGYATHGLLDACTSYGTNLYWPFSNVRVTWNIIAIIDPIFSLTLIIFFIFAYIKKSRIFAIIGLFFAMIYLLVCFIKNQHVEQIMKKLAEDRNHKIERFFIHPSIGNNILWRSIYQANNEYYVDAIYVPFFKKPKIYYGHVLGVIDKKILHEFPKKSKQMNDIERFSYFAKDFIYFYPGNENIIADLRYSILPNGNKALWGIKIDRDQPDKNVQFARLRNIKKDDYLKFWLMLKGEFYE